ncbi:MAG: hypothetical protein D6723_01705, partial [Acidobacteria bacterium]
MRVTTRYLPIRIGILLTALGATVPSMAVPQEAHGVISGYVVSDAGRPVKYATVQLYMTSSNSGKYPHNVLTGKDGSFRFEHLPPGTYRVSAYRAGYVQSTQTGEPPLEVTLEEGQEITDVEVTLMRGGVITGRVLDEDGDPIVNTQVIAWRRSENGYYQQMNQARTDDRGVYRIYGLPPGDYVISSQIPFRWSRHASYGMTYFPGVVSRKQAEILSITAGSEITGIDISLQPDRGAKIVGRVTLAGSKQPLSGLRVTLYGENLSLSATTKSDGSYTFAGLPKGTFHLHINPTQKNVVPVQKRVTIESLKTVRLDIQLEEGGQISGALELIGGRSVPDPQQLTINARLAPLDARQPLLVGTRTAHINPDGTFTIGGLPSARVQLTVHAPNNRYFLKAITRGERQLAQPSLVIESGQHLSDIHLILSDEVGEVRGYIPSVEDATQSYHVVLVPADESRWRDYAAYRHAWSHGERPAVLRGVPVGRYLLFALDGTVGFGGEAFIRAHLSQAVEV